jgi:flavodoxin
MTKVVIVYYSTYGHCTALADAVKQGVEQVPA